MDPSAFQFTLTMPGDARLLGAVRDLTSHAAGYAKLAAASGKSLADEVVTATQTAIASTHVQDAPIEFRFDATGEAIDITITCEVNSSAVPPTSTPAGGLTVDWSRDGSRQTCHIRQRLTA
jgi:hypothetical protein